jgi:hypothetical protein
MKDIIHVYTTGAYANLLMPSVRVINITNNMISPTFITNTKRRFFRRRKLDHAFEIPFGKDINFGIQDFIYHNYVRHQLEKYNTSILIPTSSTKAAVIVEGCVTSTFYFTVLNVMHYIGSDWTLKIFYSQHSELYIRRLVGHIPNIQLIKSWEPLESILHYNNLFMSSRFWKTINAEKVLIFQSDSFILHHGIEKYLEYDYIGAPWPHPALAFDKQIPFIRHPVGNGGFSLRNGRQMQFITERYIQYAEPLEYEDVFFARFSYHLKLNISTDKIAYGFAREHVCRKISGVKVDTTIPLALHQYWRAESNSIHDFFRLVGTKNRTFSIDKTRAVVMLVSTQDEWILALRSLWLHRYYWHSSFTFIVAHCHSPSRETIDMLDDMDQTSIVLDVCLHTQTISKDTFIEAIIGQGIRDYILIDSEILFTSTPDKSLLQTSHSSSLSMKQHVQLCSGLVTSSASIDVENTQGLRRIPHGTCSSLERVATSADFMISRICLFAQWLLITLRNEHTAMTAAHASPLVCMNISASSAGEIGLILDQVRVDNDCAVEPCVFLKNLLGDKYGQLSSVDVIVLGELCSD